jgi:hypothetical protein
VYFQVPFTTIPSKLAVTNVRAVASGLRHSAILTRDGHVLMCGNGKNGQLGLTDNNGIPIVEVEHPQKGTQNMNHSMLLDCYTRTVKVQHCVHRSVSFHYLKRVVRLLQKNCKGSELCAQISLLSISKTCLHQPIIFLFFLVF